MFRLNLVVALALAGAWLADVSVASIIPESDDPCDLGELEVTYDKNMECGVPVDIDEVDGEGPPVRVKLTATDEPADYYTLVMVDPDAPSQQENPEFYWLHWIVVNIPRDNFIEGDYSQGDEIIGYKPPSPPTGSGYHRYQFFAFKQPMELDSVELAERMISRANFDLEDFQTSNDLGAPVAAFQMLTERD